jgi:hypothetical protein
VVAVWVGAGTSVFVGVDVGVSVGVLVTVGVGVGVLLGRINGVGPTVGVQVGRNDTGSRVGVTVSTAAGAAGVSCWITITAASTSEPINPSAANTNVENWMRRAERTLGSFMTFGVKPSGCCTIKPYLENP